MGKDLKDFAKIAGGVYVGNWLAGRHDRKMEERMLDAEDGSRDPGAIVAVGTFILLILGWAIIDWFLGGNFLVEWFSPYYGPG